MNQHLGKAKANLLFSTLTAINHTYIYSFLLKYAKNKAHK